jgi:hypothetical protein
MLEKTKTPVSPAALKGAVDAPAIEAILRRPAQRHCIAADGNEAARFIRCFRFQARARDLRRNTALDGLRNGGSRDSQQ